MLTALSTSGPCEGDLSDAGLFAGGAPVGGAWKGGLERRGAHLIVGAAAALSVPAALIALWSGAPLGPSVESTLIQMLTILAQLLIAALALLALFNWTITRRVRQLRALTRKPPLPDSALIDEQGGQGGDALDRLERLVNRIRAEGFTAHKVQSTRLAELANMNERLSNIRKEQAKFAYALSHDLKSPNNTIVMLLEEFREVAEDQLDGHHREILEDMIWLTGQLDRLILDAISYSQSVGGKRLEDEIDLLPVLQETLREARSIVKPSGARVLLVDPPYLKGAVFQFRTLFKHLLYSTMKLHQPGRKPMVEVQTHPGLMEGWVEIWVKYKGRRVPQDHPARMFDTSSRRRAKVDLDEESLGLTLCQRIVSEYGGRIELDTEHRQGGRFSVILPGRAKPGAPDGPALIGRAARVLRFGLTTAYGHPWTRAAEAFSTELEQVSEDRLKCLVLSLRRASGAEQILSQVRSGAIDIAFIPAAEVSSQVVDFGCFFAPFLAGDAAHAGRILKSEAARTLLKPLREQTGVVGVGYGMGALRQIISRSPVTNREDLAQLKLRAPRFAPIVDFFRLVTPNLTLIPHQDVHDAFVQGRIDATDTDAEVVCALDYHQHASVLLRSDHMMFPLVAVISEKLWHILSEDDRRMLSGLLARHAAHTLTATPAAEAADFDRIRARGLDVQPMDPALFAPETEVWKAIWHERSTALEPILRAAERSNSAGPASAGN